MKYYLTYHFEFIKEAKYAKTKLDANSFEYEVFGDYDNWITVYFDDVEKMREMNQILIRENKASIEDFGIEPEKIYPELSKEDLMFYFPEYYSDD